MKIYSGIDELIGKTPLMEVENFSSRYELFAKILIKIERFNPAGSVKDRAAKFMIDDAEEKGLLKKGATIIEPTSGNTGIGLAAISARRGYKLILTMPETMSVERRNLLKAYGATVVLTDGKKGMQGAVEKARQLNAEIDGSFIPDQFSNPANSMAHYRTTGPEIFNDTDGNVDAFVAGVGTGGTLSGTGRYLKEKKPDVEIVGVEPLSSPLISGGKSGAHKIQGIGANFIPENYDADVCDKIITVSDEDAIETAKLLAKTEGILVGISSGASLYAAVEIAKKEEYKGKTIVALLPDTGERYLSTELFSD